MARGSHARKHPWTSDSVKRRLAPILSVLLSLAVVGAPVATVVATSPSARASVASGDIVFDRSSGASTNELMLRRGSDGSVVDLGVAGTTPSVSPDGGRIAFINANGYLSVMNSDGSGVTQIRQDDPAQHFVDSPGEPQWSADGQWIAFVEQTPEGDGSHYSIRKIKPDGSSMTILADGIAGSTGVNFDPTWSPDGSKIAFSTDREAPGSLVYQIYIMNASDGSNQHRTEASNSGYNDLMPIWGPDGNRIYFWSARPGGGYLQYYTSTNGFNSGTVTISQVPGSDTVTTAGFRLSPDGSTVVFQGGNAGGCLSLFTLPTVGGTPTLLTGNDCSQTDTSPTFVPASYSPTPTPTTPTPTPTPTATPPGNCPSFQLFGVRGSRANTSDTSVDDNVTSTFAKLLGGKVPGLRFTPIRYDAIPVGYGSAPEYAGGLYDASVLTGTDALWRAIEQFITDCPHVYIGVVGYSQGEQVVRDVYHNDLLPSDQQHIAFVAGYGDPVFDHVQQAIDRGTGAHTRLQGIYYALHPDHVYGVPAQFTHRVHTWCSQGDPICNWSVSNGFHCVTSGPNCPHFTYVENGDVASGVGWSIRLLRSLPKL